MKMKNCSALRYISSRLHWHQAASRTSACPGLFEAGKQSFHHMTNIKMFFRENLHQTGFIKKEIDDFIEYWIPRLDYANEYIFYPQYLKEISPLIEITFSEIPDCLLRYFYLIENNINGITTLEQPVIPEFIRNGYTIVEWGVINY